MSLRSRLIPTFYLLVFTALSASWFCLNLAAQTTISTGSIQGTITDQAGAVLSGAKVTITNKGTGQASSVTTTSAGAYASGALIPGEYTIRIEAKGFKATEAQIRVDVNVTSPGNFRLQVGQETQVVEVQGSAVAVNTEQATVQGVLTEQQIENLPINGRNFLDLAQLEPGVQIQDGGTFDPTKNGFSSVSFGGRFGRTARIELDGIDISDETVGTTTSNVPLDAIEEASLQQSSLDLSTELTSSGSVSLITKSGTNNLHGDGFYDFRDQRLNAALPGNSANHFQRNQFGGSVGGPIIKDKLFFFLTGERNKQDLLDPVIPGGAFAGLFGNFNSPYRETQADARLDYTTGRFKTFYRFTFDQNRSVLPFIPNSFQPFANVNHDRNHVVGVDFNTGGFTHSIRFGYSKFQNGITDAVTGSSIFNPAPGVELSIGTDPNCITAGLDPFCSGPNYLAPQATMQSDRQIKYDGSSAYKSHILRYGFGWNHIHGGGFAEFLGLAPAVNSLPLASGATLPCIAAGNCPDPSGGASDPLNYPVLNVSMGNGEGFSTTQAAFGFPGGGQGPDNRISWYLGDSWKFKPNFTVTYGVRYARDTGRTDSNLGPLPILDQLSPGLGKTVKQPNHDFAPQVGLTWDPTKKGKTVIRAGIGLYYENSIWNNNLFDPPGRLPSGFFLATQDACSSGRAVTFTLPGQTTPITPGTAFCGKPIGSVFTQIAQLEQQYQAATVAAGPASNPVYMGTAMNDGIDINGTELFAPNYVTPRSVQMNLGLQHEFRPGIVLTVDYLRNVATHNLLSVDANHVGDALCTNCFSVTNANAAIAATNSQFGCATTTAGIPCAITKGATIVDYAKKGLDSGYNFCSGGPCPTAAFPGMNPNFGAVQLLYPIGRSVYSGLQTSLRTNVHNPFPGATSLNLQVSYAFSRYVSTARDNDFINFAQDNNSPTKYIGPNGLDRKHQLSFGGYMGLPKGLQISFASHFSSPLPSNVNLPTSGAAGGIFQADITGDGTGDGSFGSNGGLGDLLPGTNVGAFGRSLTVSGLNQKITAFNNNFVGQATPAGQDLINSGLFTLSQLQQLGGVIGGNVTGCGNTYCPLQLAPPGAVGQAWLKTFDLGLSWAHKFRERVELRPGFTFFNVFNFANFDGPGVPFSSVLDGSNGSPNGTTNPQPNSLRLGLGSGVNAQGAPRQIEFAVKLTF
jgi:hypothetical protein